MAASPTALAGLDIEQVRVAHEHAFANAVEAHPYFAGIARRLREPDAAGERRRLMAESLRLSAAMAPEAHRLAQLAQHVLGVTGTLELYQRSGPENAAMHLVAQPILLEIHGSLLPRLDAGALLALFGHELGHYLAHGPTSPHPLAGRIPRGLVDDRRLDAALSRLSMARELTADRVALLACQDLSAVLRLMLVTVSGLAVGELTYDTDAYLAQCKELIEHDLKSGALARGETHPEHGLRAYAAWLFSETRTYRALTGRGPGTRDIADVDAVIARCFGTDDARIVHDPVQGGDVPREFLECALAAAVLVARADGELSDDELLLIEHVFASEISDWQTYLDPRVATARFLETATVLARSALEVGPTLLNLLFEVMLSDREVHPAEVAVLLEVGEALGARAHFVRALTAMFRSKGVVIDVTTISAPEEPLPARRTDVDEALQTYLVGVVRRGAGSITLRRLLRLLGSDRRSEDLVRKLDRAFGDHRVTVMPALATAGLDERLALTPASPTSAGPASAALPASRAALVAALRRLREQLVSGDGRSPSVRLRGTRRGRAFDLASLERVSVGMAERVMAQVRARKSVRVVDAADAGRHGPASVVAAELLALAREDAQCTEETGARDLYVGYPFLTGVVAGYLVRAPLVLYPVELTRDGAGARGYRLDPRRDEAPIANQSLIRLIFNKRGFAYSDELSDELEALAGDPSGGPEAVRGRLAEVGLVAEDGAEALQAFADLDDEVVGTADRLVVEEAAVLGMFPQSSSDLLQDYDGLLQDLARPDADVTALLAAASTLLPASLAQAPVGAVSASGLDWAPVIPADPSQRSVIAEARRHGATVIDGPPGTGKSQVIVNLVAEALRRGERVAVVCEKRAALDVVRQRMAAIGFGKALAVVHDVHEDRKPLFAHIAGRLEATGRVPFAAAEAEAVRAEHAQVTSALAQRSAALQAKPTGLDLTVGDLMTFAAQRAAPSVPELAGLDRMSQAALRQLLELLAALHPLVDVWGPASPWSERHDGRVRPSLATAKATVVQDLERGLAQAGAAARAFAARMDAAPPGVAVEQIAAARAALEVAVASRATRTDERDHAVFGTIAQLAATAPERLRATGQAREAVHEACTALVRLDAPVTFDAKPGLIASLSVLRRWSAVWYRIFVLGWWKARSQFRAELAAVWPERAGAELTPSLFTEVGDRIAAGRAWRTIGAAFDSLGLTRLLPTRSSLLAPTIERVATIADRLGELGAAREVLVAAGAWLPDGPQTPDALAAWDQTIDAHRALLAARDALAAEVHALRPWFPSLPALPSVATLDQLLAAWRRDGARLAEADGLIARAVAILPGAAQLFDLAATTWRELPAEAWCQQVTAAWAAAGVARLEREHPLLAALGQGADDREIERLTARLRELETERREFEIERTLARLDDAELLKVEVAAKHQRRTPAQKLREELLKEARKQRMLMPLRTFVRRFAPAGLLDVAPVWLLSPETMAILFPRQPLFDLVVFDEASQCTVEAGLPVLLRAKRVAIAGDEKQMPPSSYFALGSGADDDDDLAGTTEADETRDALRDLLTAESLLSLARPRVARAGLAWHYRCRDEALIAFSNHAMYGGELLTIPSTAGAAAPSALHWVPVANGVYEAGENAPEAARVVDLVDELLGRTPRPTVGVVTFNLKQRKAVLDAIDARRASDDGFAARWTDAAALPLDERPFVRNLEQVQGDERDVIIFSLGHAPQARVRRGVATGDTYVPARFGPLGQRGGERRLNVAISRARTACYLVASFDPAALTVANSRHQGPRLFKHFLEFAHHHHHGRRLEASRVLDLVRAGAGTDGTVRPRPPIDGFVPLQAQVALALEAAGIPYEADVGASGFRIPLAVLDPAEPTRFALALLLQDGAGSADPFELFVHRPGVLRQRGWNVLTISAASWRRRAAELIADIEALVPGCRGAVGSDVYQRHRASLAQRTTPTGITGPIAVPTQRARAASGPEVLAPDVAGDAVVVTAATRRDSGPVTELPAWALAIADELFRAALMHLEKHGYLSESDLTSMVGGPRRARTFARDLDGWRAGLPFEIEVSVIAGAKAYRRASRA
jgi:hypothetical protein